MTGRNITNNKKHSFEYKRFIKKGILLLFPWRDALAFVVNSTPFRFGEIFSAFIALLPLFSGKRSFRLKTKEANIIGVLLANFFISLVGILAYSGNIDSDFASKYLVRNIVYIFAMTGFFSTSITFSRKDVDSLMKYLVVLEGITFIIVVTTGFHLYMGSIATWRDILSNGQYVTIGGINIPRFMGTAAEAGYLAPLLVMPLFYFLTEYVQEKKNTAGWVTCTLILTFFTFSVAVYVFIGITVLIVLLLNSDKHTSGRRAALLLIIIAAIFILFVFGKRIPGVSKLFSGEFTNKIMTYFGRSQTANWSAMDRTQHYRNAWNMFVSGNPIQWFIGHGTGAYHHSALSSSSLLVNDVDEAYNLFLSTLTDRGILGLFCVILTGLFSHRFLVKNSIASKTIWIGIIAQYIHWMLTGNFWLYYFWYEIMILVGIYRSDKAEKN